MNESGDLILAGGADGSLGVYSVSQKGLLGKISNLGASATSGLWVGSQIAVATSEGHVRIFDGALGMDTSTVLDSKTGATFAPHAGAVTGLALHPSGDVLASVGVDKSYVLYDISSSRMLTQIYGDSGMMTSAGKPFSGSANTPKPSLVSNSIPTAISSQPVP